jgi:hypothetical protein
MCSKARLDLLLVHTQQVYTGMLRLVLDFLFLFCLVDFYLYGMQPREDREASAYTDLNP